MFARIRSRLTYANVMASIAVFISLGGASYAAVTLTNNSVKSKHIKAGQVKRSDIGRNAIDSARIGNGLLRAEDFAAGQLPQGERGLQGEQGVQGASGATNVTVRTSGIGTAGSGNPPSGDNGGNGGNATCNEAGCAFARAGEGGRGGGATGAGGGGGSASCSPPTTQPPCSAQGGAGGGGSPGSGLPQPGVGGAVGLHAACLAGERAVGGGVTGSARDAVVYVNRPATANATDTIAGALPTAWYVEVYNQSRAGEARAGVNINVRAYAVCAAP